ncbi:glycogenin glucosyltransferase [Ascosphaera acerosa]|nr:glycogenin glucosyltransferase [Ascosphaera acerosa]
MVLAHSLRDNGTIIKLVALVTADTVSPTAIEELKTIYDDIVPIRRIINHTPANLYLMGRPDLIAMFSKIELWRQLQYQQLVYIDADAVALRAPDELFDLDTDFAAAPDIGWPDCFNSGMMVLRPNLADYEALMALAESGTSFDGADQGLLNLHFAAWDQLSFTYNCTPSAHYQYVPAFRQFQNDISIVHFIGNRKPWQMPRDGVAQGGPYRELLAHWWATYDQHYKPQPVRASARVSHQSTTTSTGTPALISTVPAPAPASTSNHQPAWSQQQLDSQCTDLPDQHVGSGTVAEHHYDTTTHTEAAPVGPPQHLQSTEIINADDTSGEWDAHGSADLHDEHYEQGEEVVYQPESHLDDLQPAQWSSDSHATSETVPHELEPTPISIVPQYVYGEQHVRVPYATRKAPVVRRRQVSVADGGSQTAPRGEPRRPLLRRPIAAARNAALARAKLAQAQRHKDQGAPDGVELKQKPQPSHDHPAWPHAQPAFRPPMAEWDPSRYATAFLNPTRLVLADEFVTGRAVREPPPKYSQPEAPNLTIATYSMSQDTGVYRPPEEYINPKATHLVTKRPATDSAAPLFNTRERQESGDRRQNAIPDSRDETEAEAPRAVFPWEEYDRPRRASRVFSPVTSESATPSRSSRSRDDGRPSSASSSQQITSSDIWRSFSHRNAWDDVPEIHDYMRALDRSRSGSIDSGHVLSNGEERRSVPQIKGRAQLPEAAGVPRQAEWNPRERLERLRRHQLSVLVHNAYGSQPAATARDDREAFHERGVSERERERERTQHQSAQAGPRRPGLHR